MTGSPRSVFPLKFKVFFLFFQLCLFRSASGIATGVPAPIGRVGRRFIPRRQVVRIQLIRFDLFLDTDILLSDKLNDVLSGRLFYTDFDSPKYASHFNSSCFSELFS